MNGHDAPEISHANAPSSSGLIEAIDKTTVHKICSGQVVLSLATAVKELVENSIDAGATNIEVRVKEYGSEQIEVIDNGHGVEEANFEGLTLKHHTSKLQDFTDLWTVDTFGFRGEALSSLCALSTLSIITCHRSASVGTHLEYDNRGVLIKRSPCPREVGTTVTVKNIFSTLPVRHKEFLRNLRREYTKMVNALSAYALIHTDVRIVCSNQPSKGKKSIVLSSQLCNSLKESIACIFGTKQLSTLLEFQQSPLSSEMIADYSLSSSVLDEPNPFKIEGWISTCAHGQGRSSADRQFFYVNNRPCDLVKVSKVVNKVYHSFNRHQYPFVLLNITVEKGSVDVNVTPDKRKIFVENEKLLLAIIEESLLQLYKNIPSQLDHSMSENAIKSSLFIPSGTSIKKDSLDNIAPDKKSGKRTFTAIMDMASRKSPALPSINKEDSSTKDEDIQCLQIVSPVKECKRTKLTDYFKFRNIDNKSTHSSASSTLRPSTINEHKSKTSPKQSQPSSLERFRFKAGSAIPEASDQNDCAITVVDDVHCMDVSEEQPTSDDTVDKDFSKSDEVMNGDELEVDGDIVACDNETSIDNAAGEVHYASTPVSALAADCEDEIVVDEPSFRDRESTVLHVSLESLKERMAHKGLSGFAEKEECLHYRKFKAKITPSDNDSAEAELRKQLSKDDFEAMEIIGQFNLGFIIAKKDSDLFIIDQHATDEKYNFEMLQQNTVLETQGLIQPQKLELTAVNESLLLENMDVFLKNGFSFEVDDEAPVGQKVRLVSVPVSHNWTFGKSDIDELIFMLSDSPGVMCRPSRVRQMFASRACRKSVMIGTALSLADMKKLVRHMGTIEQPWNCPHGRPTIRHLFDLNILQE